MGKKGGSSVREKFRASARFLSAWNSLIPARVFSPVSTHLPSALRLVRRLYNRALVKLGLHEIDRSIGGVNAREETVCQGKSSQKDCFQEARSSQEGRSTCAPTDAER